MATSSRPLVLGGNANGTVATDAQELFAGVLDESCVFKRALTAAEVTTLNTTNCAGGSGGGVVSKRAYTYNPDSSVATSTITQPGNVAAGLYQYTYDRGNRLRAVIAPNAVVTGYTYDAAGNRLTAGGSSYFYDQRNRLTSGAGTTFNWSARGTLASTTGTGAATYVHDGLDRLTQAGTVSYAYDSMDRVTTRTVASVATPFSYAGSEMDPVAEGTSTKYLRVPSGQSIPDRTHGGRCVDC
jgi:YD repeat-containing protein